VTPLVIAHRGASGYRPEHTLAAYELAIDMGADYIEPDLAVTRDGVLVARHENEISATTDVAGHPEFAHRRATKRVDGVEVCGWFTEDFTLAELKTLRARERIPRIRPANTRYDDLFTIPTLTEIIELARRKEEEAQAQGVARAIGLYPETKHPSHFRELGLPMEERLVDILHQQGYRHRESPVFIQSFEVGNLKLLREMTGLPLIQLIEEEGQPYDLAQLGETRGYHEMISVAGLSEIARYAQGIGVHKNLIIPWDAMENLLGPSSLIDDAHRAGLLVHAWTFRRENNFLPANLRAGDPGDCDFSSQQGDATTEYQRFFQLGVDGVFSDNPDIALAARRLYSPAKV
jgi:glycerophosphoryl diester phosphodiesterase